MGPLARRAALAGVLLLFPLVGDGYVRVRWPDPAVRAEMDAVARRLEGTAGPVCAQTALFPQLPYDLDCGVRLHII